MKSTSVNYLCEYSLDYAFGQGISVQFFLISYFWLYFLIFFHLIRSLKTSNKAVFNDHFYDKLTVRVFFPSSSSFWFSCKKVKHFNLNEISSLIKAHSHAYHTYNSRNNALNFLSSRSILFCYILTLWLKVGKKFVQSNFFCWKRCSLANFKDECYVLFMWKYQVQSLWELRRKRDKKCGCSHKIFFAPTLNTSKHFKIHLHQHRIIVWNTHYHWIFVFFCVCARAFVCERECASLQCQVKNGISKWIPIVPK